jgi:hypothetical protein
MTIEEFNNMKVGYGMKALFNVKNYVIRDKQRRDKKT